MKYYDLKAMLASGKQLIAVQQPSTSFCLAEGQSKPYIEPTFQKVVFEQERPTIVLISAVGATGKTALAEQLSRDARLPLLDLGKHKPVGDNTLTGLLTHSFNVKDISQVFSGLGAGTFGVIIDGIDEGRSKTTEKAFDAFLDDITHLCKTAKNTTFVLLGRTQILDDCWVYLSEKVSTALITISPFDVHEAKQYVDILTKGASSNYATQYANARDEIIRKLSKAFAGSREGRTEDFLSFIGYPPVLDAVATLLTKEDNYHKLLLELGSSEGANVEISLLSRISEYILRRDRDMKIIPNVIEPLLEDAPEPLRLEVKARAFSIEEQCIRLVAHCLGRTLSMSRLGQPILDEKYEAHLVSWMHDHPFVTNRGFRNAVFEAFALATLISTANPEYLLLLKDYLATHKHSYHLVYMADLILKDRQIPIEAVGWLTASAMEFRSTHSRVEIHIDSPDWSEPPPESGRVDLTLEVEVLMNADQASPQTFAFRSEAEPASVISLGPHVAGAFVSVSCPVRLVAPQELELTAPLDIEAPQLHLAAKRLILKSTQKDAPLEVALSGRQLFTDLEVITTNGVPLTFALESTEGLSYPTIQYCEKTRLPSADPLLLQKYLRFRRILMEFRAHSRGSLARFRDKIESDHILKNEIGHSLLKRLIQDGILNLRGSMYHLDQEKLDIHVGVTWQDLRIGNMPTSLEIYLRSIM